MATKFQIKRSNVSGVVPTTGDISSGELAVNLADKKLFTANTTAVFELGSNLTSLAVGNTTSQFIANASSITISTGQSVIANNSAGAAGQILTTNGSGVYWSTVSAGGVNTAAQYTWTNTQTFTANATFNDRVIVSNNTANAIIYMSAIGTTYSANSNARLGGGQYYKETEVNNTSNGNYSYSSILNRSTFDAYVQYDAFASNSSNHKGYSFMGAGPSSSRIEVRNEIPGLLNRIYLTANGSAAVVNPMNVNNSTGVTTQSFLTPTILTFGNSTVNSTYSDTTITMNGAIVANSTGANNAFNLGGVAASGYQTTDGLAANVATLAANSATYANQSITNTFTVGTGTYFVANGYVGLNTNTPTTLLTVSANGVHGINLDKRLDAAGVSGGLFFTDNTGVAVIRSSAGNILLNTNAAIGSSSGTTRVLVSSNGSVGIGTNTPAGRLHVAADSGGVATYISSYGASNTTTDYAQHTVAVYGGNNIGAIQSVYYGDGTGFSYYTGPLAYYFGTTSSTPLIFINNSVENMRLDAAGNLGIGNTNPQYKLHVTGSASISANTIIGGWLDIDNYVETRSAPTISGGTLTLDLTAGSVFNVALNAAITTLTISNVPSTSNKVVGFVLIFTADGTPRSVAWPASVKWPGNTAPTITSTNGKKDVFSFFTADNGTTFNAFVSGQNI